MNQKQLINLGILAGASFLIYNNRDKILSLFKKKSTEAEKTEEQTSDAVTPQVPAAKSEYQKKVEVLQGLLKVGIDGKAGKQTNGALENLYSSPPISIPAETSFQANYPYLRKNGKGAVSPQNVDFYINALKTKTTPYALYNKNKSTFKLPWE